MSEEVRSIIHSDDELTSIDALLQTVPGVGPVLSSTLLADMNELGMTDRRSISSLAGLAPFNHDSGRMRGARAIRGVRSAVRKHSRVNSSTIVSILNARPPATRLAIAL